MGAMRAPKPWQAIGAVLFAVLLGGAIVHELDRPEQPRHIPDGVLLQPADVGGARPVEGGPDLASHAMLPRPCDGIRPIDPLDSRTQHVTPAGGHLVYEFVGRYPATVAAQVAKGLAAAVTRCPDGPGDIRNRIAAADQWGPHSSLLTREWDAGRRRDAYLVGVAGDYLVVVLDTGDGGVSPGDVATAGRVGTAALRRAGGDPVPVPAPTSYTPAQPPAGPPLRWVTTGPEVTGIHAGPKPNVVTLEVDLPGGDSDCGQRLRTEYVSEENDTVYANVLADSFQDLNQTRCRQTVRGEIDLVVSRPFGDRPILVDSDRLWGRDGAVYRRCTGTYECKPPLIHCQDSFFHDGGLPESGYRELRGCDGTWAVLDTDLNAGACGPGCVAEPNRQRFFLTFRQTWRIVDRSTTAGCRGVHAAEPDFPTRLCAVLPGL